MIFGTNFYGNLEIMQLDICDKTVGKIWGMDSRSCYIQLKPLKLSARVLYYTYMVVSDDEVTVITVPINFPYIFRQLHETKESICTSPKFENDEWNFVQELKNDLRRRKNFIMRDDDTGRYYDVKCVKVK